VSIEAKVICDSVNPNGVRLTTMQLKYQRFIHSELMTHRVFSRNASSSRAIPVAKMIEQVRKDPAMPVHWGKNQSGMKANAELDHEELEMVRAAWLYAADEAAGTAEVMANLGAHKQIVNRLLEPFQWIHVVVTATEWDNFFALRCHPDAQPEIQELAYQMREAMSSSIPQPLEVGEWHLPYVSAEEKASHPYTDLVHFSAARCARVSYLLHDGTATNPAKDRDLHDKLVGSNPPHLSPVEHQAQARDENAFFGNFRGWKQYRKYLEQL
jgi:hypothetical protein